MTGMSQRFIGGGDDRVRADIADAEVELIPGMPVPVTVEVTNVDSLIRRYQVEVLGIDERYVDLSQPSVALFPDERLPIVITFTVPEDFPAGRRRVAVYVTDAEGGDAAVMVAFDLVLATEERLRLTIEPETVTVGKEGTFVVTPENLGNTSVDVRLKAEDPERKVSVAFDPEHTELLPGDRRLVTALAVGERPWFGMPAVRVLEFTATAGDTTETATAVMMQRPRFSRRLLAILGMVLVVTLFAFVIMQAFGSVADRAEANEQLLKQGLGHDGPVGIRAVPASMQGRITSTTGEPIDGATVELYDPTQPLFAAHSTVTRASGAFRFGALPEGEYVLRVEVAGFDEVWFPDGESIADAEPFELGPGAELVDVNLALEGRPGSVSGLVQGADVEGALVSVRLPAEALDGSELAPTSAEVTSMEVDATGRFTLTDLATPATYEIVVSKPGFATETRTATLAAGEQREGIDVLLRTGDGQISGVVVDGTDTPIPNVDIVATDGSSDVETRSLSGENDAGTFQLRDLPTPATFTITATAEGHFTESVTVQLEEQQLGEVRIVMTASTGRLAGTVRSSDGQPLGGVDVIVDGAEVERTTVSLSDGEVGSWLATDLPVPGEYTVTFSRDGYATQALSVELVSGPQADRAGVDGVLTPSGASVHGVVEEQGSGPIAGVTITLESAEMERRTRSSDEPLGAYRFDDLPAGAYTITYERVGSRSQTLLVDLDAGERRQLAPVELEPQARIGGVITVNGVPSAGVGVVAYPFDDYPGEVAAETVSTTGGRFEIVGLDAPQTYILEFETPAGGPVQGSRTVFLQAGEDLEIEVDL